MIREAQTLTWLSIHLFWLLFILIFVFGHETIMNHLLTTVAFSVYDKIQRKTVFQVPFPCMHGNWQFVFLRYSYNCPLLFYFSSILFDYFCSIVACYAFYSKSENKLHLLVFYLRAHLTEMDKHFNCLFLNKQVNTKYRTLLDETSIYFDIMN